MHQVFPNLLGSKKEAREWRILLETQITITVRTLSSLSLEIEWVEWTRTGGVVGEGGG
jgi:hypothetical protein